MDQYALIGWELSELMQSAKGFGCSVVVSTMNNGSICVVDRDGGDVVLWDLCGTELTARAIRSANIHLAKQFETRVHLGIPK